MNLSPDDPPASPSPAPELPAAVNAWGQPATAVRAEQSSADASAHSDSASAWPAGDLPGSHVIHTATPDPVWNGWDVLRLVFLTIVALFAGVLIVLLIARWSVYPRTALGEIARVPLVIIAGQSLAYLLVFAYMYVLVTRERRRPDFLAAIHWNWPSHVAVYILIGFVLSLALQGLAHLLPIPRELPIDSFFKTPAEAWALGILSVTLAPLMEELFFRGFLYPVLARSIGLPMAVLLTALAFAALHGAQLMFSWGPVLVIFLVGLVLTLVRAKTNSVAAGVLIHMAYNGTITVAMFAATDGFRHLEKLNQ